MPRTNAIQIRRGTSGAWTSGNPTLASGEPGFETDNLKLKIGDGSTAWTGLNYIGLYGAGTSGYLPKYSSIQGFSNSLVYDDGTNVGIGLTNPAEKLEINGSLKFANCTTRISRLDANNVSFAASASAIGHYGILIDNTATANGKKFRLASWCDGTTPKFIIRDDSSGADRLTIDTNGNLGIGNTSPSDRIHISGSQTTIRVNNSLSYDTQLRLIDPSSDWSVGINQANNAGTGVFSIRSITASAHRLVIDGAGNVGIGTTSPGYKLQVNGSFGATTKSFRIDHPSKKGYSLEYGSLESPYHGVRLTGRGKVIKGVGVVELPNYLKDLIHNDESITIQLTNYKHSKTLYISKIDLRKDQFIVKAHRAKSVGDLEFFWTLTGVRKDVPDLVVEKSN